MTPTSADMNKVCAQLEADWKQVELQLAEVLTVDAYAGKFERSHIATTLQRAYQSLENLIARVERAVGREPSRGDDWHKTVLAEASQDVPGIRPALFSSETERDWQELRAFRHFFIHGSVITVDLDAQRLADNVKRLARAVDATRPHILACIEALRS